MACNVYKGADFTLTAQFNRGAYRAVPSPTSAMTLKFSSLALRRNPARVGDPTVNNQVVGEKSDEMDEAPDGQIKTIACLNDARFWLEALFGTPATTGSGPYVHTFTLGHDCRPDFLAELKGTRTGGTARYRRYVGGMVRRMSWDVLGADQSFVFDVLMGGQVRPHPSAAFDTTPTAVFPKARAQAAKGEVYDVSGSSTLGLIAGATLQIDLGLVPERLADGVAGYGAVRPGAVRIGGTLTAVMTDDGIEDAAEAHTTKKIVLKTQSIAGTESLVFTFPSCELAEVGQAIPTKAGIVKTYRWDAVFVAGDPAVTAVLTAAVARTTETETLDPAETGAGIVLSNGNLTATAAVVTAVDSARASTARATGKFYYEATIDSATGGSSAFVGICTAAHLDVTQVGGDATSWAYGDGGHKWTGGSFTVYGASYGTGAVIGVAIDADAGKVWFSKNGAWQGGGDPVAGTGAAYSGLTGPFFPCITVRDRSSGVPDAMTLRFHSFVHTPPAGFSDYQP